MARGAYPGAGGSFRHRLSRDRRAPMIARRSVTRAPTTARLETAVGASILAEVHRSAGRFGFSFPPRGRHSGAGAEPGKWAPATVSCSAFQSARERSRANGEIAVGG